MTAPFVLPGEPCENCGTQVTAFEYSDGKVQFMESIGIANKLLIAIDPAVPSELPATTVVFNTPSNAFVEHTPKRCRDFRALRSITPRA